jgi:AbrB family looped-hinge helix DNA binding protein
MHGYEMTMTQKGQVTIPAAIRARLGLRPRDRVRFEIVGDEVRLSPARSRHLTGFGAVRPHKRPEDWNAVRDDVERLVAEDVAED